MTPVTVHLAGRFVVRRDGADVHGIGGKARRLLVLLAVERDRIVPTGRIVAELWDEPPRQPTQNIATLVSRLRTVLGTTAIEGGRGGYRLGDLTVDLDEAGRLVAESSRRLSGQAPGPAATAAQAALALLGVSGVLVDEPDTDCVRQARTEGERLLREARLAAADAACRSGDAVAARVAADAAIAADPLDEPAHRLLMTAHQLAGEPGRALACYDHLRASLAEELGVDPDPRTREVHLAILRELPPGPAGQARAAPAATRDELVGRSAELDRLGAAWSAACAGHASLVLVTGEGGIGKTALAAEASALAGSTGGLALGGRCYASERSLLLQPFVDALAGPLTGMPAGRLRELVGSWAPVLVGLLPALEPVLGSTEPGRGSPEFELRRAYDALAHVLGGLAADRPVLLTLDDLHNSGLATVGFVHYLARRLGGVRLLLLATLRAEEGEEVLGALDEVADRMDVGPLSDEAVARLARAAGRPDMAETIQQRTRGHTLFVVESLRALSAGDRGVPESLRHVVLARLRRAGPATEELLRAGAVLGPNVDPAVVAAMIGLVPHVAAQRCEVAAAARLLVTAGSGYEFVNDLVQEVVYATTPLPTRVAHHRRAADVLGASPELVARHATAAEDWPRAARALLLAADEAGRRSATEDAALLAGRAVEAARRAGEPALVARSLMARGRSRVVLADFPAAYDDQRTALDRAREAGDRRLEMLALRELGGHAGIAVSMTAATDFLSDGLRIAESLGDHAMQARFQAWLAVLSSNRLQFTDALGAARRATVAARASGDDAALAAGLDGLKNAHAYLGQVEPLGRVLDELVPLLRRLGESELLQWAVFESAVPAVGAARWEAAEDRIGEAITISRAGGFVLDEGWFTAHLAGVARMRGHHERSLDTARRAMALVDGTDHRWYATNADVELAGTLLELGRCQEAVALLGAARERAEREGAEAYLLRCLGPLAEATGSDAVLADADALLARVQAPPGSAWLWGTDAYVAVARSWLRRGDPARTRTVLAPLLAAAERQGWVPALTTGRIVDARACAALGDVDSARSVLHDAAVLAEQHGMPRVARDAKAALETLH